MLRSYLFIAFRRLLRKKGYTAIHLLGLTLGVGGCMVIFALIRFEYSYDHAFSDYERIYRFTGYWTQGGVTTHRELTPEPLAPHLVAEIPEVEDAVRIQRISTDEYPLPFRIGDERFQLGTGVVTSENSIFSTLGLRTLSQNQGEALNRPATVVLSQALAQKLFRDQDPIGRVVTLDYGDGFPLEVTGILPDQPRNTSLRFEMIMHMGEGYPGGFGDESWGHQCCETYVKLREGASAEQLLANANALLATYQGDMVTRFDQRLALQPLDTIHLYTLHESGLFASPRQRFLRAALACALFILFIACMSFIGLTVSAHNHRLKDLAIRRAFGARKADLLLQIGAEVAVLFFFAYLSAIATTAGGIVLWNRLALGSVALPAMTVASLGLWAVWMTCIGIGCTLVIGLQVLSISAAETIAGRSLPATMGRRSAQPYATGFQFAVSVMLLTLAVIALKQLSFIRHFDLGFDKENVMVVDVLDQQARAHALAMRDEVARLPGVRAATVSSGVPGQLGWRMLFNRRSGEKKQLRGFALLADRYFLTMYGIASSIDTGYLPDGTILLNQTAAAQLGLETDRGEYIESFTYKGPLGGVVEDFRFDSLKEPIGPLLFVTGGDKYVQDHLGYGFLSVKVDPTQLGPTLARIERIYDTVATSYPFTYAMLKDDLRRLYAFEEDIARLLTGFSLIAFVLSCLGLLAVVARWCAQVQREVAIRKVLGAGAAHLYWTLVGRMLSPVALAFLLGTGVGLWIGSRGLQDYQAVVEIGLPDVALLSGLVMATIIGTSIYHLRRTIVASPTLVLAHE